MWTTEASTKALIEVVDFYSSREDDHIGQKMVAEAKTELKNRDVVKCHYVPDAINKSRTYWIEGKTYEVTRRTKASFWVIDEVGFERRFSSKTGGSTEEKEGYKTYMF